MSDQRQMSGYLYGGRPETADILEQYGMMTMNEPEGTMAEAEPSTEPPWSPEVKDYSIPLHVDCSIEYELPEIARPPHGAKVEPLIMIHPVYFRMLESRTRVPFVNNMPKGDQAPKARQIRGGTQAKAGTSRGRQQPARPLEPDMQQRTSQRAQTTAAFMGPPDQSDNRQQGRVRVTAVRNQQPVYQNRYTYMTESSDFHSQMMRSLAQQPSIPGNQPVPLHSIPHFTPQTNIQRGSQMEMWTQQYNVQGNQYGQQQSVNVLQQEIMQPTRQFIQGNNQMQNGFVGQRPIMAQMQAQVIGQMPAQTIGQTPAQVIGQMQTQLMCQMTNQLVGQMQSQMMGQMPTQLMGQITNQLANPLIGQMPTSYMNQIPAPYARRLSSPMDREARLSEHQQVFPTIGQISNALFGPNQNISQGAQMNIPYNYQPEVENTSVSFETELNQLIEMNFQDTFNDVGASTLNLQKQQYSDQNNGNEYSEYNNEDQMDMEKLLQFTQVDNMRQPEQQQQTNEDYDRTYFTKMNSQETMNGGSMAPAITYQRQQMPYPEQMDGNDQNAMNKMLYLTREKENMQGIQNNFGIPAFLAEHYQKQNAYTVQPGIKDCDNAFLTKIQGNTTTSDVRNLPMMNPQQMNLFYVE